MTISGSYQKEDPRPKNPVLRGCDYAPGSVRSAEWNVWSMRRYQAEFTVFNRDTLTDKPAINGSGEGSTIYRALFAAAADCVGMGADRDSVISGLSVALTGEGRLCPPQAARVRTQNQGRRSKLKNAGAAK